MIHPPPLADPLIRSVHSNSAAFWHHCPPCCFIRDAVTASRRVVASPSPLEPGPRDRLYAQDRLGQGYTEHNAHKTVYYLDDSRQNFA